jgi:hypothetical protein
VSAVIAEGIHGSGSEYAEGKIRVISSIRPKGAVAANKSGIVVGVGDSPRAVELIGVASGRNIDLSCDYRAKEICPVELETVGVIAGSFGRNKGHLKSGLSACRNVFAADDVGTGEMVCAATIGAGGDGPKAVFAKHVQSAAIRGRRPCYCSRILESPSLCKHGSGRNRRIIGNRLGDKRGGILGKTAIHHRCSKAQNDNNKTYLKSYLVIFHVCRKNNDDGKVWFPCVSNVSSERSYN